MRSTYDILTKGSQTTNRILGCEDQCNQVLPHLYSLRTNYSYYFTNVTVWTPLRHVYILVTPTGAVGATMKLDPLYNAVQIIKW
jgi:hypothetical protein